MNTIISITEMKSMPGRYCCTHQTGTGRVHNTSHAGRDPAEAAAHAIAIAMNVGGGYIIFAPQRVIDLIPLDLRVRQ